LGASGTYTINASGITINSTSAETINNALTLGAAQTWNGAGANDLWSNGNNWVGGIAPANLGTAAVAFGGSTPLAPDMDANWNILSLTFNSGAGARASHVFLSQCEL